MIWRKRCKRRRRNGEPAVSGPFAETYWRLRRLARARRLFVLFDGDPAAPRLTFFDAIGGMPLLDYWPKSCLWACADRPRRGGKCKELTDILAVALRLAGQRQKSDKSQSGAEA
jgi:hypothetical protein